MTVIDLQTIRYINLLDRVSKVKTSKCFNYNNSIIFAVPKHFVSKAIGANASNIRNLQDQLGKRIRIIPQAEGNSDVEIFIKNIINPLSFKSFEIKEDTVFITAGSEHKAALIGRNRRREEELRQIVMDTFGYDLKIL